MRKLWTLIAQTGGATAASGAVALFALALTSHLLGPSGRGVYAATISWVALFTTVGSLSLGQVVVHHVAGRPVADWAEEVTGSTAIIGLVSGICGWIVVALLYVFSHGALFGDIRVRDLVIGFAALPFLLWREAFKYVLSSMGALPLANKIQIGGAMLTLACLMVVGILRGGPDAAIGAASIGGGVAGGLAVLSARHRAGRMRFGKSVANRLLRGAAQLHLNAVGNYLFAQGTVLVLNYYRSPKEVAYYQMAVELFTYTLLLPTAVSTVAFSLVAQHGANAAWPQQRKLLVQTVLLVLVLSGVAYLAAPLVVRLIGGAEFAPTVPLFRMMLPALVGASMSTVMASQWIGRGLFLQAAGLTLLVGLISLATDLVFVPRYGMQGAVISTLVTYGISVVGNSIMAAWTHARWREWQRTGATQAAV